MSRDAELFNPTGPTLECMILSDQALLEAAYSPAAILDDNLQYLVRRVAGAAERGTPGYRPAGGWWLEMRVVQRLRPLSPEEQP